MDIPQQNLTMLKVIRVNLRGTYIFLVKMITGARAELSVHQFGKQV